MPDQYGRRWDGDDGESPKPRDPHLKDLPPLRQHWGGALPHAAPEALEVDLKEVIASGKYEVLAN